jgi:Tol biopolymer transport system component
MMEEQRGKKMTTAIMTGFVILAILLAWGTVRMRVAAGLPAWGYREGGPTSTPRPTPTNTPGPTPTALSGHPGNLESLPNIVQLPTPGRPPSPFGEKIAFVSDRNGQPQVYVINSDGSDLLELTEEENGAKVLGWTRAGWLAFVMWPEGQPVVYVMNAEGQERTPLSGLPGDGLSYAWTVDGRYVAISRSMSGNLDLFVMGYDGSQGGITAPSPGREDHPSWSPDGNRLVFVSDRDQREGDLYIVNRDGTGLTRLTDDALSEADPAWSPDGDHIAFVATTDPRGHRGNIFVIGVDGSDRQQLTDEPTDKQQPVWSPDGSRIAFQAFVNDSWGLYVLNVDDRTVTLLTSSEGEDTEPRWSP